MSARAARNGDLIEARAKARSAAAVPAELLYTSVSSSGRAGAAETFDVVSWLTVYIIVLYAIPSRLVIQPLGSAGAISMLLGLVSLGLWFAMMLLRKTSTALLRAQPLRWAVGVFLVCVGLSYVLAMSRPMDADELSPADVALLSVLSWTGVLLLTNDGVSSRRRLDTLLWRLSLCGGAMALLGIAQFVFKRVLVDVIAVPGLTPVSDAILYYRNGLVRPSGTAIHPIEFGALLVMILPIALHVAFHHIDRWVVLRWLPAAAIVFAIVISSSRSAYLGALVAIAVCMIAWSPTARHRFLVGAVVVLAATAVIVPRLFNSVIGLFAAGDDDPSISSRTDSFGFAWAFIAQHPVFGRGLGTFLPKYRIFDNQYLGMLVSIGVVGTIALLGIAVVVVLMMVRAYGRARTRAAGSIAAAAAASVMAGFVSLAFFDAFAFPMTMGTLFLVLGIAGAHMRLSRQDDDLLPWGG